MLDSVPWSLLVLVVGLPILALWVLGAEVGDPAALSASDRAVAITAFVGGIVATTALVAIAPRLDAWFPGFSRWIGGRGYWLVAVAIGATPAVVAALPSTTSTAWWSFDAGAILTFWAFLLLRLIALGVGEEEAELDALSEDEVADVQRRQRVGRKNVRVFRRKRTEAGS